MPRASLQNVRTEEILDAFQRLIERHTVGGVSLEMVAEEAGMKRSVVRHFVGNRDDLLVSLGQRVFGRIRALTRDLWKHLKMPNNAGLLIEVLLLPDEDDALPPPVISDALIKEASRIPELQAIVTDWFDGFVGDIERVLATGYPEVEPKNRKTAAYGIVTAFLAYESLEPLGLETRYRRDFKTTAEWIVQGMIAERT